MSKGGSVSVAILCLAASVVSVVVMSVLVHESEAVTCDPTQLTPCLGAITGGNPPSAECCNKLKEQVPCYCGYLKNPVLRPYIESPGAKRVASTCGITISNCSSK
ncbi:Bifunctional inhibitor/lipid-transfer protein/seed storage 2S albumin superfamily protein [Striga hermonthica]|uniref:Bifunctional inhibitor/lipid-transfer protein/seed storage 2S albumin superfamily protein n=1 Tax=Striga hermonthica TaxID=68872 RepID=A0A9N7N4Q7_STRHE|nr:Bifunctional inhibitor/lipid-transfer protein/seed storage 2S albumin superfamily protein [Striga hermonthica]